MIVSIWVNMSRNISSLVIVIDFASASLIWGALAPLHRKLRVKSYKVAIEIEKDSEREVAKLAIQVDVEAAE